MSQNCDSEFLATDLRAELALCPLCVVCGVQRVIPRSDTPCEHTPCRTSSAETNLRRLAVVSLTLAAVLHAHHRILHPLRVQLPLDYNCIRDMLSGGSSTPMSAPLLTSINLVGEQPRCRTHLLLLLLLGVTFGSAAAALLTLGIMLPGLGLCIFFSLLCMGFCMITCRLVPDASRDTAGRADAVKELQAEVEAGDAIAVCVGNEQWHGFVAEEFGPGGRRRLTSDMACTISGWCVALIAFVLITAVLASAILLEAYVKGELGEGIYTPRFVLSLVTPTAFVVTVVGLAWPACYTRLRHSSLLRRGPQPVVLGSKSAYFAGELVHARVTRNPLLRDGSGWKRWHRREQWQRGC